MSRALKDNPEISQQTRKTVQALAKELGYKPNPIAVALKTHKSNTIGVVVPQIVSTFFATVVKKIEEIAGKEHLVLDLSCRKKDDQYFIVTDRWQKFTNVPVTLEVMEELGNHCDEFLVHAVDVEGKANGIETELADLLSDYTQRPVTYAGGVGSMEDLKLLKKHGKDRLDVTVGSALDLFGGTIPFETLKNLDDLHI